MKTPDRFSANRDLLQTPESRRKPSGCMNTPTAVTPKSPSCEMRGYSPNSESRHQPRIDAYASQHGKLARHQTGMEPGSNFSDFPSLESMEMPGLHFTGDTSGSSFNAVSRLDGLKQDIPTYGFNDLLLNLELNLPLQEPRLDIQNFVMDNPIPSVNHLLPFSDNLPPLPINVELKNAHIMKTPVKDNTDNIDDSTIKDIPSVSSEKGPPGTVTRTEVSNAIANTCVPIKPLQVIKSADITDPSIEKNSSREENLQFITATKSHEASTNKLCPKRATSVTQPEPVHPPIKDSSLMPSLVKNKQQNTVETGMIIGPDPSKTQVENQLKETGLESNNNLKQSLPLSVSDSQPKINNETHEQTHAVSMERNHNEITNRNLQGASVANTHHHQYQPPSHHQQYHQHPSQSRLTNFPSQPSKQPQTLNGPNQSEFPPYQYMHPQPSANAYFPTAASYPPYSYNHAPYGVSTYPYPYQSGGSFYSPYYQQGPGYYGYINSYTSRQFCPNSYYSIQQANQVTGSNNQQVNQVAMYNGQQATSVARFNGHQATNVTRFNGQQATNVTRFNGQQANLGMRFNGQQANLGMRSNAQPANQVASLNGQQVKLGSKSNDQVNHVPRFNNQQANHVPRFNNQQANHVPRFNSQQANPGINGSQANQVARLNDEQDYPVARLNGQYFPYYSLNGIKRMKLPEAPTQVNKVTSSYLDHNKNRVDSLNSIAVQSLPNSDQCTNVNNVDPTPVQKDKHETDSSILNGNPIEAKLSSATTDTKSLTNASKTEELSKMSGSNITQNCTKCTNIKARIHSIKRNRINDLIFIIHDTDDDSCDDEVCTIETEEFEEDLGILCDDCGGVVVEEEEVIAQPETDGLEEKDNQSALNESIISPKTDLDDCFNSTKSDVESLQYIQPSEVSIFKLTPREEPKLTDFAAQNMNFLPQSSRSMFTPVETYDNVEVPCISEAKNKRKSRKSRKAINETASGQPNGRRGPGRPKGSRTRTKKNLQNNGKKCWNCFATKSSAWYTHRRQTKSHLCCSCYKYYKTRNEEDRKLKLKEQTSGGGPIIQHLTRGGPIIQHLERRVNDGQNGYEKPVVNGQYDENPAIHSQHDNVTDVPVFLPQAKQKNLTLDVSLVDRKTSVSSDSLSGQVSVKEALNEKEADFDVHILNVHKASNILDQSNLESLSTNDSGFSEDFFGDLFDIDIKFINDVIDMNNKTADGLDLEFFQNIDCSSLINPGETLEITNDKPRFCQKIVEGEGSRSNQPETNKKSANLKPKANQRKKSSKRSKRKDVGSVTVKKDSKCHTVDVMPEGKTPVFSYSFSLPDDF